MWNVVRSERRRFSCGWLTIAAFWAVLGFSCIVYRWLRVVCYLASSTVCANRSPRLMLTEHTWICGDAERCVTISGAKGSSGFGSVCNVDLPFISLVTLGKSVNELLSASVAPPVKRDANGPYLIKCYDIWEFCILIHIIPFPGPWAHRTYSNFLYFRFPNRYVVTSSGFVLGCAVRINPMIISRSSVKNKLVQYCPCFANTMLFWDDSCYKKVKNRKATFPLIPSSSGKIQTLGLNTDPTFLRLQKFMGYHSWVRNGHIFIRSYERESEINRLEGCT